MLKPVARGHWKNLPTNAEVPTSGAGGGDVSYWPWREAKQNNPSLNTDSFGGPIPVMARQVQRTGTR